MNVWTVRTKYNQTWRNSPQLFPADSMRTDYRHGAASRMNSKWSARLSRPGRISESTRFLGQPKEIKPPVGTAGGESLVTGQLCRECCATEFNADQLRPEGDMHYLGATDFLVR